VAAAGAVAFQAPLAIRLPLGLAAILVCPGYCLTALCFPGRAELSGTERMALSLGLSLALMVVTALFLNYVPGGISLVPVVAGMTGCTLILGTAAVARRSLLEPVTSPLPRRERARERVRLSHLGGGSVVGLAVALVLFAAAGTALAVVLATTPAPATQFYALGPQGRGDGLPSTVHVGQPVPIMLGITTGPDGGQYRVVIQAGSQQLASDQVEIGPNQTWQHSYVFQLARAGAHQEVDALLLQPGSDLPLRTLRLWLDVNGG